MQRQTGRHILSVCLSQATFPIFKALHFQTETFPSQYTLNWPIQRKLVVMILDHPGTYSLGQIFLLVDLQTLLL